MVTSCRKLENSIANCNVSLALTATET